MLGKHYALSGRALTATLFAEKGSLLVPDPVAVAPHSFPDLAVIGRRPALARYLDDRRRALLGGAGEFQHELAAHGFGKLQPVVDRDHEGARPADDATGVVEVEVVNVE